MSVAAPTAASLPAVPPASRNGRTVTPPEPPGDGAEPAVLAARVSETERELSALREGLLDAVAAAVPIPPDRMAWIESEAARFADDPILAQMERHRLVARAQSIPGGRLEDGEEPDPEELRAHLQWVEERQAAASTAREGDDE